MYIYYKNTYWVYFFMTYPSLGLLKSVFLIFIQVFQDHENPGSSKIKTEVFEIKIRKIMTTFFIDKVFKVLMFVLSNFK